MMRNKEFKKLVILQTAVSALGAAACFFISTAAGCACLAVCAVLILLTVGFTYRRYRAIDALSQYLSELCRGDTALDIDRNEEGELSILKNNIYKTAVLLRTKTQMLLHEKQFLADTLADLSHQVKTPVASMQIMTDILREEDLSAEKRAAFLENIDTQLGKIQWIIQNLLVLSKLDAQSIVLKHEPVLLSAVIDRAVEALLIPMELRGQTLLLEGERETAICGDENWTAEAVSNIVKNCMEHTPNGGTVRIVHKETALYTRLSISDTGCGIDKADIPHIFERFYKGRNASPDSVGIGLALAKTILTAENADVTVQSEPNVGTEFIIKFYKGLSD